MSQAQLRLPAVVAHADWGSDPGKRQVAIARLTGGPGPRADTFRVVSLAPARQHDFLDCLRGAASGGQVMIGFDFPLGLPRSYAEVAGVARFPEFLMTIGGAGWEEFGKIAAVPGQIAIRRPFYPAAPGGSRREHLYAGLGLGVSDLRRRCEGMDAETLFWTLGAKQAGRAALHGWAMLAQARRGTLPVAFWPFDGALVELMDGSDRVIVAETYPREFYPCLRPAGAPARRWSKRRRDDRLLLVPGLLTWARVLRVTWDQEVLERVRAGLSAGPNGEDEFDAVVGLLGMIAVVSGAISPGEPPDDAAVTSTEGWILGRGPAGVAVSKSG